MDNFKRALLLYRSLTIAMLWAAVFAIDPVAPTARAACLPVPAGLASWWPLGTDALDIAGTNAGVVEGGASFAAGKVGQGMVFDGINSGVHFAPSPTLNVGAGGGFTVELWMKPDAVNVLQPLIEWNQGSIGTYLWYAGTGTGTLDGDLIDTAGVEHPLNAPAGTIVAGVWQHVAMTYDRASGLAVLYRNGIAVLQQNWGQMTPQTSWPFHLGSRGSYRFKGVMDEVSLFNRALSGLEIQSIYQAGSAGKCGPDLPPTIFAQPVSLTGFIGSNVAFSVLAGGSLPLAYQWFFGGIPATDGQGATLSLTNLTQGNAGDYYVVITNSFGAVTSAVVALTIMEPPAFDLSRDFSTTSNPGGPWSYGWVGAVGGAFSPLTAPHATATAEGAQIRSWQFSPSQAPAVHHNISAITGTSDGGAAIYPPGSTLVAPGENGRPENFGAVRFTAPAGRDGQYLLKTTARTYLNGPASGDADYHVVMNGVQVFGRAMPGNSSTGYTNTIYLAAGDAIDFTVGRGADNNLYASGLILEATLELVSTNPAPPLIVASPQSRSAVIGGSATFSVIALGSAPFSYQWTRNGVGLSDATNATLTLSNVQLADSGDYRVVVSNSAGPAISEVATLVVSELAFELARDFSSEMNPGPVWSYGWQSAIGSTFTPLTFPFTVNHNNGVPVTAWALGAGNYPIVYHNGTTNTAVAGQGTYPPGTTWFHPGFENTPYNLGVIRCTIPTNASGNYRLESTVLAHLDGNESGDCDYHVAANGVELFGQFLPPRTGTNFSTTLSLNAGDTVDFLIGRGADGRLYGSGLKLDARLSLLPSASNTPPAIIVQPQSRTVLAGSSASFSVVALGSALSYQWNRDGALLVGATNATLALPGVLTSQAGHYSVVISNAAGSVSSADAVLTVIPSRTLALIDPPAEQEGSVISVPLNLISEGDVGGMTFNLDFNTAYVRLLEWEWSPLMAGVFSDLNTNTAGRIRVTFALPATAIPAGDQPLATLRLLLRSVPNDLNTPLTLQVTDVAGPLGDPITLGNQTRDASLHVTARRFIGDNNANQRLDVGDATTILRLLALLDAPRAWDVPANDINTNNLIDTGDAIRVLRAAAGIDPQPGGGGLAREAMTTSNEKLVLTPAAARGTAGAIINVEVRLQDLATTVSGAAFTLDYPTNALRLVNSQAFRVGATVPGNALAVWNVAPAQNNFATQNGHLSLAVSSANKWAASTGTLAIISFQVQPGASSQYAWPLVLRACEVTPDGYANRVLKPYGTIFIGRNAVAGSLDDAERTANGLFQFTLNGDLGARYTVQASSNLLHWTTVTNVTLDTGGFRFIDMDSVGFPRRFYRSLAIEP